MMLPPHALRLRILDGGRRSIRLWLPLFLLWPLFLIVIALIMPVIVVVSLIVAGCGKGYVLAIAWQAYAIVCSLSGLKVDVADKGQKVYIEFK